MTTTEHHVTIDSSELRAGSVLVSVRSGGGKFGMDVHTKKHCFISDEPEDVGGENSGPSPFELLLASVGTCAIATLKMYADHKKINLGDFHVAVSQSHQQDPVSGEKYFQINRELIFHGQWSEEQLAKFKEIAEKCPVHRVLQGDIRINTQLVNL
jgi:uncharacterized OsmC-like protein